MDTSNLDRVEFLKGPSSLMSGLDAIGGSVNYVNRQPTTGAIKNELDTSIDTLGTYRTHFGSGGSTAVEGLDYRVDLSQSRIDSFIDGDYQNLSNFSGQLNYRVSDTFKVFGAIEYKHDQGHAYWGTPLVPTSFSGPFAKNGVVSGTRAQHLRRRLRHRTGDRGFAHADHQLQRGRQFRRGSRTLAARRIRMGAEQRHHAQESGLRLPRPTALVRQRDLCVRSGHLDHRSRPLFRRPQSACVRRQHRRGLEQLVLRDGEPSGGPAPGQPQRHQVHRGGRRHLPGRLGFRAQSRSRGFTMCRRVRPVRYPEQPPRHPRRVDRRPSEDNADVRLDRRRQG